MSELQNAEFYLNELLDNNPDIEEVLQSVGMTILQHSQLPIQVISPSVSLRATSKKLFQKFMTSLDTILKGEEAFGATFYS